MWLKLSDMTLITMHMLLCVLSTEKKILKSPDYWSVNMGFFKINTSNKCNNEEKEQNEGTQSVNLFPRNPFKLMLDISTYFL